MIFFKEIWGNTCSMWIYKVKYIKIKRQYAWELYELSRRKPGWRFTDGVQSGAFRVIRQDVNFEFQAVPTFWGSRPRKHKNWKNRSSVLRALHSFMQIFNMWTAQKSWNLFLQASELFLRSCVLILAIWHNLVKYEIIINQRFSFKSITL